MNNSPTGNEIRKGIEIFVEYMRQNTLRLVELDDALNPKGIASGIMIEHNGKYLLLSAGHCFRSKRGWIIETSVVVDNKVLSFTINELKLLYEVKIESSVSIKPIDVAWAKFDIVTLKKQIRRDNKLKGKSINLPFYKGPFGEEPSQDEAYGFASWGKVELDANLNILFRELVYEVGMEYCGINSENGLYEFKLSCKHQGHDYYQGSSGSPIADPTGKIVSIVLGGCEKDNVIYGFPIAKFTSVIGL